MNKLVLFWAPGCEPCSFMRPIIKKISKELNIPLDEYNMVDNGVEQYAVNYGVKGWPHLLVIKNDIIVTETIGYDLTVSTKENKERVLNIIKNGLK